MSSSVVVDLRPSLPVPGVSLILGNDIAGGKVEANPCVSDTPSRDVSDPVGAVTELFPSCAVTHAMAKANAGKDDEPGDDMLTSTKFTENYRICFLNLLELMLLISQWDAKLLVNLGRV